MAKKKKKKNILGSFAKSIIDMGVFLLAVLVITYVLSNYVVQRFTIHNHSMEDTLMPEDGILIDKISYRFREPERYDVIIFKQNGTGEELIKRIIALPFETVQIKDGIFYINGEAIDDIDGLDKPEYAGEASREIRLSEGEYFVVGDNRAESIDSRYSEVSLVTSTRIIGRALIRITPISKMKIIK